MVRIVAVVIIAALLTPSAAVAGPLLEAAMRKAAEIRPTVVEQPMGCAAATAAGQDLADRREGSGGYLAGGIFIPVIMPLIGMAASPTAPAAEIANLDDRRRGVLPGRLPGARAVEESSRRLDRVRDRHRAVRGASGRCRGAGADLQQVLSEGAVGEGDSHTPAPYAPRAGPRCRGSARTHRTRSVRAS